MILSMAVLVPLLPLLGSLAGLAAGRRVPGLVRPLAVLPTLAAAVLAVAVAADLGSGHHLDAATRLTPTGGIPIDLSFHLDGFSTLLAVLVGVVATCVQVYSTSYLRNDARYPSYTALVSLFTAAMLLVLYSGDLIVLLVGWEVMGICSYFLVGHHWENEDARSASIKAFLVTKLGDVPFLFGILALGSAAGTFGISGILQAAADGRIHHPTVIALLLLCGVAGKSAQFPLHTWLPDAMAGPTPVSALIHAATMVAAGIYLVARLLPVFLLSSAALAVLGAMAAVTMVGSALCALAQDDIKRVLAYSTVGQLGYMAGALAVGDRDAAVFHLLTHGAFKALLFLAAGVVIHAAHTNSLTAMSRMADLRRRVPDAYWTMTIGLLALAGIPPFSGFFSKDAVLTAAEDAARGRALTGGLGPASAVPHAVGWTVLVAGLLTGLLTAVYATRLWLLTFRAPAALAAAGPAPAPGAEEPGAMRWPLWLLAVPAVALGLAGLRTGWLPSFLDGTSLVPSGTTAILGTAVALAGVLIAYAAWRRATALVSDAATAPAALAAHELDEATRPAATLAHPDQAAADLADIPGVSLDQAMADAAASARDARLAPDPARLLLGPLLGPASSGFGMDRLYRNLAVRPVLAAAGLARFLDREVIETYIAAAVGLPRLLGAAVRRAQNGNTQTYLSALLAGAVVLAVLVETTR
ncbi:NADH-quinone oxidoreductase subunit L [Streptacidiphilus sp. PB12-B1b]|uniref:NADH-quinone oxidoreductase subunit 5 family protein n=1 Tax=Streptacidiphilus sp. PB12-B1b TaxID=2705012 RepID=UPI0015F93913|nr:NADH-quinone oxidoreductase subunit L [Streptacidiphilus sp. PB12-B1b]QMU79392.1 NADH-quinone oxidoreductase subunit L [Streptacidiphilus sp. PB12-B1b]